MDEKKERFVRSLLVCTKNFGKFKKGKSYKLSITLVPDVYVSYDDMGNEFSAQISESDLFSHFDYANRKNNTNN